MSELLGRAISPFQSHPSDVGIMTTNFWEAIHLLPLQYTQSPHWAHEPTQEMKDAEEEWKQEAKDATAKIKELAADIYLALTGEKVPEPEPEKHIPSFLTTIFGGGGLHKRVPSE